ncbi:MAG: hypothetical protein ACLFU4_06575 [Opitutales bacterium]
MFLVLDKLRVQGLKKVIVAVPECSIAASPILRLNKRQGSSLF